MSIDISSDTLRKLEHQIPEIRARAIENVQSKFQSCRTDLQELAVDVNDLVKRLLKWFDYQPVTNVKQIFDILLALLKSKYQSDAVRILSKYGKRGDLNRIRVFATDPISKSYYDEIIQILNAHKLEYPKQTRAEVNNDNCETPKTPDIGATWKFKDINENRCSADGLRFEMAWEVAGQRELQELSSLKSSLSIKSNQNELDHALQYFQHRIKDFPGEFFLQSPFVFMGLLQLIECERENFDYTSALTCCLKLTQNLTRRITMRRVSSLYVAKREHTTKQQVTIGSYCYKTFDAVLDFLRNIYADSDLASVNECFLILIEIVELVCKTAGSYSPEVAVEYHFDEIISKLADFLRFIREMTSNYGRNGHKTNRNNSISIIFLLCQLLIFKESRNSIEEEKIPMSPVHNESTLDLDISQRIRRFSLKDARKMLDDFDHDTVSNATLDNHTASESTITGNYITAMDNIDDAMCRRELEIALLDFPLKHFYPQVNELIVHALK
ncbi:protein rotatin homolog, partial [Sitodiplosis mosellana]|uniref:protein rotatin homolog n=1 Tax=Sitodiplosis mosellana TaxID=263140 RepID=UPI002444C201